MKNEKTNWTSPKTNIFAAANDLRKCLASGYKGKLIRISNEDCIYPILIEEKKITQDFREYEFSYGAPSTKAEINADASLSDYKKYLSLNYHAFFGTEDAVKRYYTTGILSAGNFFGIGRSHLVKVSDMIEYLEKTTEPNVITSYGKDKINIKLWYHYIDETDDRHLYDYFRLKNAQERTAKIFKHKLYAVEMCGGYESKNNNVVLPKASLAVRIIMTTLNIILYPTKYIPQRDVLIMDKYKCVSYRIGDVVHGYRVEFQIPRKFSFKDNIK